MAQNMLGKTKKDLVIIAIPEYQITVRSMWKADNTLCYSTYKYICATLKFLPPMHHYTIHVYTTKLAYARSNNTAF
jgi:hypothetical protein